MTHTLVAAFDSLTDAEAAKAKLVGLNIAQGSIQLSSPDATTTTAGPTTTAGAVASHGSTSHHDESFGDKVSHFFSSLFGDDDSGKPHHYASAYPEAYRRGATLLTVNVATDEEAERVEDILESSGAIDIDERSATWTDGAATSSAGLTHVAGAHQGATGAIDRSSATLTTGNVGKDTTLTGATAIPVIEEQLRVGKREVTTGRVRVVTRVTERPVEETVNLHEEHAVIERNVVDREATAGDLAAFKEGSIEITETAEEAVVGKTARVVEEVRVGTAATDRTETIRDTVRRTDVDVDNRQGEPLKAAASAERNKPLTDRKI